MIVDDTYRDALLSLADQELRQAVEYRVCAEDIGLQVDVLLGSLEVDEERLIHVIAPGVDLHGLELQQRAIGVALQQLYDLLVLLGDLAALEQVLGEG